MRVAYRDHVTHHTVEARSTGRDGDCDTWGDRVATRRKLRPAGHVAAPVAAAAASAAIGGALELWNHCEEKKAEAVEEAEQAGP